MFSKTFVSRHVKIDGKNSLPIVKVYRMYLIKPVLLSAVIWLVVQSPLSRESTTLFAQDFPGRLKILSYNIHHGEGVDKKLDLERIAKLISESDADIVALQEVDVNTSRSQHV